MKTNSLYFKKRDRFYFFEVVDRSQIREALISQILGTESKSSYYCGLPQKSEPKMFACAGNNLICLSDSNEHFTSNNIMCAKFWKDQDAANHHKLVFSSILPTKMKLIEISQEIFVSLIPEPQEFDCSMLSSEEFKNYNVNLKLKKTQLKHLNQWNSIRSNYKCGIEFKKVKNPYKWKPCPNCKLIPLEIENDNTRNTGCGCDNFSIRAESIASVLKRRGTISCYSTDELRDNWNYWVETGIDRFSNLQKEFVNIW